MIRLETLNRLIRMFHAADTSGFNPAFGYVRLKAKGSFVCMDATDGTMLAEVSVGDPDFAKLLGRKARYCHYESLKALKKIARESKFKASAAAHVGDHGHVVIEDGESVTLSNSADLPDFDKIRPVSRPTDLVIGLDVAKLYDLVLALQDDPRQTIARLTLRGPLKAVTVTVGDYDGLIMPCRVPGGES